MSELPATVSASGIQTLDTVEVLGKTGDLIGTADSANQGTVLRAQLENRPILRPGDIVEVVPGLIVTQHSGDGKANQFFLRGFNLDHGTDLATSVAGMPVNMPTHAHGQGYTDLNFLIPELISRVQYRKGPYYATEGDFAAAGAVHIDYAYMLESNIAHLSAGSFGFRRGLLAGSPAYGSGRLLYGIELFHNDGPWENPEDYRKINNVVRYSEGGADNGFAVTGMAYRGKWNATDQIPQRALDGALVGRFGALDKSDGGETYRYSLSGDWARKSDASITTANAYVIAYKLDLFSNFTFFLDDPVDGDQFQQADRRRIGGFKIGQTRFGKLGGRDTEHAFGMQVRHDDISRVALYHTRAREILTTTRADRVEQTSTGLYYQNLFVWNEKLRTLAGVRTDFYSFDVHSSDPPSSGARDDDITSPKLSFILGPWAKTEYYLNFGRGFHSNDARGTTAAVDPVTPLVPAKGAELGARSAIIPGVQSSLSIWRLDIDSELLFIGDAGTTAASRPSRRTGVEWANYWKPLDWFTGDLDVSVSRARFRDDDPTGLGNHIPGAIEKTVSVGAVVDGLGPWSGGVRLRYFGPRPLDEDNDRRSRSSTLVNANVGYKVDKNAKLTFEVFNITDATVNDIEYFYESRPQRPGEPLGDAADDVHFHPAEPRSVRATLSYRF